MGLFKQYMEYLYGSDKSNKPSWQSGIFSNPRQPQDGDPAFTIRNGREVIGKLSEVKPGINARAQFTPDANEFGFNPNGRPNSMMVGYSKPFAWDDKRQMWFAPPLK